MAVALCARATLAAEKGFKRGRLLSTRRTRLRDYHLLVLCSPTYQEDVIPPLSPGTTYFTHIDIDISKTVMYESPLHTAQRQ